MRGLVLISFFRLSYNLVVLLSDCMFVGLSYNLIELGL